ncbi:hypothetical protein KC19_2G221100 [Ceratodon purpureus]|uniref:Uncharacterized protein n=1 Tax=Ceratodon purpureus TaxID=3225 RepID=A0A8T0IZT2_CERPU|nr:hypothetical protein KC19_2G221100 [Ceratodon purpureus]
MQQSRKDAMIPVPSPPSHPSHIPTPPSFHVQPIHRIPSPLPLPNPTPHTHPQPPQTPRKPPPSLTSQRIHHQRPILQLSLHPHEQTNLLIRCITLCTPPLPLPPPSLLVLLAPLVLLLLLLLVENAPCGLLDFLLPD